MEDDIDRFRKDVEKADRFIDQCCEGIEEDINRINHLSTEIQTGYSNHNRDYQVNNNQETK
jgi:hypothetical protein